MNISDHIIDDARYIASPNYDSRPEKTSISLIIIHAISMPVGEYVTENIVKLFTTSFPLKCFFFLSNKGHFQQL